MSAPQTAQRPENRVTSNSRFFLYVEGPGDECILRIWARRFPRSLALQLESRVVILGGRRPARAQAHFRAEGGSEGGARGLVVLDRDHHRECGGLSLVDLLASDFLTCDLKKISDFARPTRRRFAVKKMN